MKSRQFINKKDMTKTIKEWFEELEEPYKTLALKNLSTVRSYLTKPSLESALLHGFEWPLTNEG